MSVWKQAASIEDLNRIQENSLASWLGIEFVDMTEDSLVARMPVDSRTKQPFGLLHGGASVVLSETMGSVGGFLAAGPESIVVGLEVNANHLRSATEGFVTGTCRPLHVGRTTQVWETQVHDDQQRLVCVSRLTVVVKSTKG
ncbi:1,4-dihydroxy-2-naphthoyl-CoA hydrolase [Litorivivens lipolytica]|uniref:1,4-dihydroxy-2-naphthoyl-CoA hydrolase n=1 Tax=Litorivivens lipolytica TaxID=1524264 RepID=A0A7W4Z501_9GAMM|nr:hotdog fold thioesterase [Litorivivens lipolytica]MBB3046668.1 1,4-dihydroxy-2-naphthoyl-CoA hydrolase [Litorivivens lipolytica]